ncbi:tyrosine-type recombinase/integrase [Rhodobacterales bacterium FZCC0069]|nr:tyrosine-type recombinase/integrase [Rhodobacterales bacterium FZCC0069]
MPKFSMKDGSGSFTLRYVIEDRDRHGNVRIYLRKPGQGKIRLHAEPGTQEFIQEYRDAFNGLIRPKSAKPLTNSAATNSFKWLCEQYFCSAEYMQLAPRTRHVRRLILEGICRQHGAKPYDLMEPRHVRKIRDTKASAPEAANALVKALRQVFNFAIEYELANSNPARDVPYLQSKGDGFHSWSVDEVAQFEAHHPIGSKARLALALLLYTGQRRSDVVRMGPQHVKDGYLNFTQEKNKARKPVKLSLPILPELQHVLDQTDTGHLSFLVTQHGRPFTANGFGNWFRKQCDAAGLKHCSAHGLRKAGAAIAAENGATERQLMAMFGWSTLKEASRYTRSARQKILATAGMQHLSRHQNEPKG